MTPVSLFMLLFLPLWILAAAWGSRPAAPTCPKCGGPTVLHGGMGADVELCQECDR